jgi:multiple antibiotic resistance protein
MLSNMLSDFWLMFATIDPFGTLILFLGLTSGIDRNARRSLAVRAVLYATAILLIFLIFGQLFLEMIGVRLVSFQFAGSIILFLFGLQMFFIPSEVSSHEGGQVRDLAVFPLALPSLASPGSILAIILATENTKHSIAEQVTTGLMMLLVMGIALAVLLGANSLHRILGGTGEKIMVRISGLILASLACEFFLEALGKI